MRDSDLIRRIDAMQACHVAPSDEWAKATKDGYNQAATDCAMSIMRIEPVATPTNAQIMADPRVKALIQAGKNALLLRDPLWFQDMEDAIAQLKEYKPCTDS